MANRWRCVPKQTRCSCVIDLVSVEACPDAIKVGSSSHFPQSRKLLIRYRRASALQRLSKVPVLHVGLQHLVEVSHVSSLKWLYETRPTGSFTDGEPVAVPLAFLAFADLVSSRMAERICSSCAGKCQLKGVHIVLSERELTRLSTLARSARLNTFPSLSSPRTTYSRSLSSAALDVVT